MNPIFLTAKLNSVPRFLVVTGFALCALFMAGLSGCAAPPTDSGDSRIAFVDLDAGRIGVCELDGSEFEYITPDSLWASEPVADSSGTTIYFCSSNPKQRDLPNALYAVETDGSYLRKIAVLPFVAIDLQVTPDGGRLVFVGSYPDQEFPRAFQMVIGEGGFSAITSPDRAAYDISVSPGGLNFVYHDSTMSDPLWVSELNQKLTLPIAPFPYTQVSIAPDGFAFAAICGPKRAGLCHLLLKDSEGNQTRDERMLVPESVGKLISHPIFHPDGQRVAFVETDTTDENRSMIRIVDINSMHINELPSKKRRISHPAWVR